MDKSKVLNLTTNELSDTELEVLSLGLNFKLQGTNNSIIEAFEGFERFDAQYSNKGWKPSLRMTKKETLLALKADKVEILPLRYTEAIKSIRANERIKVVLSDKGKRTVVCYASTYETILLDHYSNTALYQPVCEEDIAGRDLETMTQELIDKLKILANKTNDQNTTKIIKSLMPPSVPKFPQGRVNLKVHKEGVTQENIPVRPIVSNTASPTSNLAGYLGKHLTSQLGEVSEKHVGSVEKFAACIKDCTVEGRMLSLDVVNLFTCIPIPKAIEFLRNTSNGWGPRPPTHAKPITPPTYKFPIESKLFCDLVELCLSFNQFQVNDVFLRQVSGLFMGSSISPPIAMAYMEDFEKNKYEKSIPNRLKASVWKRFVDDCFLVYRGSEEDFETFLDLLNNLDSSIKFTCERSTPGTDF